MKEEILSVQLRSFRESISIFIMYKEIICPQDDNDNGHKPQYTMKDTAVYLAYTEVYAEVQRVLRQITAK